jgi:hypothetical protein
VPPLLASTVAAHSQAASSEAAAGVADNASSEPFFFSWPGGADVAVAVAAVIAPISVSILVVLSFSAAAAPVDFAVAAEEVDMFLFESILIYSIAYQVWLF